MSDIVGDWLAKVGPWLEQQPPARRYAVLERAHLCMRVPLGGEDDDRMLDRMDEPWYAQTAAERGAARERSAQYAAILREEPDEDLKHVRVALLAADLTEPLVTLGWERMPTGRLRLYADRGAARIDRVYGGKWDWITSLPEPHALGQCGSLEEAVATVETALGLAGGAR